MRPIEMYACESYFTTHGNKDKDKIFLTFKRKFLRKYVNLCEDKYERRKNTELKMLYDKSKNIILFLKAK